MNALGPGRLSAVSCGRCAGRAGSRGLTSQRGAPGAGCGAGGAPGASRGGVVSESVAKAPRAGIGGEEKRGISTFLFQCSGPVRAFATDSDKRRRRGPLCGRQPPAPGLQHQGPPARAPARTAAAALAPTPGPTRPDPRADPTLRAQRRALRAPAGASDRPCRERHAHLDEHGTAPGRPRRPGANRIARSLNSAGRLPGAGMILILPRIQTLRRTRDDPLSAPWSRTRAGSVRRALAARRGARRRSSRRSSRRRARPGAPGAG